MDAFDLKGIADTEETYKELHAFFEAFDKAEESEKALKDILSTNSATNLRTEGLRLFKAYWRKVWDRARFGPAFDQAMIETDSMPWLYAKAQGLPYPDPYQKVST